jgi:nucleoside transporter
MSEKSEVSQKLSVMMFLEFFIWGAWYVTVGNYIGAQGWENAGAVTGNVYTLMPIAALISPLFVGLVADRFFSTEKVLSVLFFLGGGIMLALPTIADTPGKLTVLLFIYTLSYAPTLALTNSLAFHHVTNPEKQFPLIRVFGTIGWIVAGIIVSKVLTADTNAQMFYVTGIASILLGFFSLALPHTPPLATGKASSIGDLLGFGAIALMANARFAIFMIASFLICIPLAAYYAFAPVYVSAMGIENPGFVMGFGQWAEVVFMLIMPLFFIRLGVKWMLAIGMLAWVLRYVLFSLGAPEQVQWMILGGILLHGICYDFFFVTGQIFVDKAAPKEVRAQAQGFLVLMTQGLGLGIGAQVASRLVKAHTSGTGETIVRDWAAIWQMPALLAAGILVMFILLFRSKPAQPAEG